MAFDGITISSIVNELNDTINGGRLYKISRRKLQWMLHSAMHRVSLRH